MRTEEYTPYTAKRFRRTIRPVLWYRRNREDIQILGRLVLALAAVASVGYLWLTLPDPWMFSAFGCLWLVAYLNRKG